MAAKTALARHLAELAGGSRGAIPEAVRDDALRRITAQAGKVERARRALARERDALVEVVAYAVSVEPSSPTWYDKPSVFDRREVARAARLSATELDTVMRRFRGAR